MKKALTFYCFVMIYLTTLSQENESCLPPSKKVSSLLKNATSSSDIKVAADYFAKAIDASPENATVYFEYGLYVYNLGVKAMDNPSQSLSQRSFSKAEELFKTALDLCPDSNAIAKYYLGYINEVQEETEESIRWYKEFNLLGEAVDFPGMQEKLEEVSSKLKELESSHEPGIEQVPFDPSKVLNVSTRNDEYFPMISPDNELLFYTRKVDRTNLGDMISTTVEEFTVSQRESLSSLFNQGEPLKSPFNNGTFTNYGSATLSVDNKEMIICACKSELVYGQNYLNCDLYSTTYKRSGEGGNDFMWSPLKNMGTGINTKDGWEAQPSLSADGNTLFYTVARPNSKDNDIYVVERNTDGTWGVARPFDEINTAGKDKSPFLHQDSETLYFVSSTSEKRKGVGGLDIFYTRKENGKWTEPKNIGYPINSKEDEIGLFISTDGKIAYYSSRMSGNWDIYSFELYEAARPKEVSILKGQLTGENGDPITDATLEIAYALSDQVTKVNVNGDDGKYAAVVKIDTKQDVMVTVKKEGYAFDSKLIKKDAFEKGEIQLTNIDLTVKELKVGDSYTINDILYATNSSVLTDESKFILKSFARFLKENPKIQLLIQGHTDDIGDDKQNMTLSENRAKGVRDYLISLGIESSRLSSKGYGELSPKVENDSDENRAINRRTDFSIKQF
jgi:outer membrane protein OmpA-like peptidoglycan-associated protein/Tol biopolymer transport system component